MGSVFVTQSDRTVKGFLGKEFKVPFFLQFLYLYMNKYIQRRLYGRRKRNIWR